MGLHHNNNNSSIESTSKGFSRAAAESMYRYGGDFGWLRVDAPPANVTENARRPADDTVRRADRVHSADC